jgi:hypothetical protein
VTHKLVAGMAVERRRRVTRRLPWNTQHTPDRRGHHHRYITPPRVTAASAFWLGWASGELLGVVWMVAGGLCSWGVGENLVVFAGSAGRRCGVARLRGEVAGFAEGVA